jgi:exonuclease III
MKVISWNVRGLGRVDKRKEVRNLVREKNPLIVCLQETKLQVCDDSLGVAMWGSSLVGFSLWDTTEVEVWSSLSRDHVLWCHGRFIKTGEEFMVANVYAPCDPDAKQGLWDALSSRLQSLVGMRVCVCGDFNAVRNTPERRSTSAGQRPLDQLGFNRFIDDNFLVDLPLGGRKYTWYRGDGRSMSRLDRFLLS